ncbi:MAG: acyl transferase [Cyclobacteriaceae bacterium]
MNYFKSFSERIKSGQIQDFETQALKLFHYQAENNLIYRKYLEYLGVKSSEISSIQSIPFLPVSFFKNHKVITGALSGFDTCYTSSGTTGQVSSRHYLRSKAFYLEHAANLFEMQYGNLKNYHILALLPSYLERKGSSLVDMVAHFMERSQSDAAGFYLFNHKDLMDNILHLQSGKRKVLLIGVTFALLDLAEGTQEEPFIPNLMIMETGGMKGRRREMIREEVHGILKNKFGVDHVHSEYGMTELISQAYSRGEGIYTVPPTMGVYIRDVHDPFDIDSKNKGAVNIIDLANFNSCAFIETQDLGEKHEDGTFSILGRIDNSELRGCNLMVN